MSGRCSHRPSGHVAALLRWDLGGRTEATGWTTRVVAYPFACRGGWMRSAVEVAGSEAVQEDRPVGGRDTQHRADDGATQDLADGPAGAF